MGSISFAKEPCRFNSEIAENAVRFQEISEEIADVMIYCLRLCSTLNMDPISIINEKIEINTSKYPIEKSIGSSLKSKNLED